MQGGYTIVKRNQMDNEITVTNCISVGVLASDGVTITSQVLVTVKTSPVLNTGRSPYIQHCIRMTYTVLSDPNHWGRPVRVPMFDPKHFDGQGV